MEAIICYKHKRAYVKGKRKWRRVPFKNVPDIYTEALHDIWDSEITACLDHCPICDKCKKDKKEKGQT